ncbi:MAG TPA: hypothetical protein VFN67_19720 [Polyangiales bacterium]|nr:hypothetical protein [Polyangiales bacterium]
MVSRIVSLNSGSHARSGAALQRRAQVWLLASLPVLCGACIPQSVYTTHNVALPVMLGPMRTLRSHHDHGAEVATFSAETQHAFAVSSSTSQQGAYQVTTTTTSVQDEDATKFDAATATALTQCATCSVKTDRVRVGSYYIYWLVAIMSKNWAGMNASLHAR